MYFQVRDELGSAIRELQTLGINGTPEDPHHLQDQHLRPKRPSS